MLPYPPSLLAALWLTAAAFGREDLGPALGRASGGFDEARINVEALAELSGDLFLLALPRPGRGITVARLGASGAAAAMASGECVVARGGCVLVPTVTTYGPATDRGRLLEWSLFEGEPVAPHRLSMLDLRTVEQEFRDAVRDATGRLERLGGTPWPGTLARPGASGSGAVLPRGVPDRAARLIETAMVIRVTTVAGLESLGALSGPLDGHTLAARQSALRAAGDAATTALADGTNVAVRALAGLC